MKKMNIDQIENLKWDGFEQAFKTPPKVNEPTIKFRDYDGVNGEQVIWSPETGRWEFTGLRLQDIPPTGDEPITKTNVNGRRFTWSPEKNRWWSEESDPVVGFDRAEGEEIRLSQIMGIRSPKAKQ